jgi:hypothetical protein
MCELITVFQNQVPNSKGRAVIHSEELPPESQANYRLSHSLRPITARVTAQTNYRRPRAGARPTLRSARCWAASTQVVFWESIFQDPCPTLNGTRRATMPQVLTRRSEPIHPSSQARSESPAPTNPKTGSGSDHPGGRSPQLHCSISSSAQSHRPKWTGPEEPGAPSPSAGLTTKDVD